MLIGSRSIPSNTAGSGSPARAMAISDGTTLSRAGISAVETRLAIANGRQCPVGSRPSG
jgi:hypothetical protein